MEIQKKQKNRSEPRHTARKTNLTLIKYRKSVRLVYLHVCLFKYDSIWPGLIMRYRPFLYCPCMYHPFKLIPAVLFDNDVTVQLSISHLGQQSMFSSYSEDSCRLNILTQCVICWVRNSGENTLHMWKVSGHIRVNSGPRLDDSRD